MSFISAATKTFGSLLGSSPSNKISGFMATNTKDAASTLTKGLSAIGRGVLDEAFGGLLSTEDKNKVNDSPYPLGNEWIVDPAYMVTIAFTDPNTQSQATVQGYMPDTISMGLSADYSSPLEGVGEALSGAGGPVSFVARMMGNKVSSNIFSVVLWSGSSHMDLTLEMRFVALSDSYSEVIEPIRKLTSLITPTIEPFSATNGPIQLGFMRSPGPSFTYSGDSSILNNAYTIGGAAGAAMGDIGGALADNAAGVIDGSQSAAEGIINAGGQSMEAVGGFVNNALKDFTVKNNISVKLGEFALLKSVVVKDVSSAYNVKADAEGNWTDATVTIQIGTFVSPTNLDIPDMVGYKMGAGSSSGNDITVASGLEDSASDLFKKTGLNSTTDSVGSMLNKMGATATTAAREVSNKVLTDITKLGKDAGMGTRLMTTVFNPNAGAPSAPGMTATDVAEFSRHIINT